MRPGDAVVVLDRGKKVRGTLDSVPEFGWACVLDLRGRAGSASVPLKDITSNQPEAARGED